eukprot:COSAG06_NODE_2885_length_6133_cov_190.874544_1_plen_340_part_00
MAELSAASESMAAIIDSYSKANFLDKNGNKDTTTSVDKDQVLKAVTDKYKKQNKIAHKMFDTVVAALKKKKYEPKGARFRATKWDTDLMPFHKLRNKAMSRPGYDHQRWSRRKRKIRLKSWRKWANNLIVQSVEAVKNHDFAKESQILKALGYRYIPERDIDDRPRALVGRGARNRPTKLFSLNGPVVTDVDGSYYVAAVEPLSSNVAELSGVAQALLLALREILAGRIRIPQLALAVDSRIAMYKVANMAAQKDKKSRLTGTAGLCLELITRINEMGVPVRWVWVKGHSQVDGNEAADQGATKGKTGNQTAVQPQAIMQAHDQWRSNNALALAKAQEQ